jgi:hypothetical protein
VREDDNMGRETLDSSHYLEHPAPLPAHASPFTARSNRA